MTPLRFGNRIDEVVFDTAWHELMTLAMREGEHCGPWVEDRAGAQVARAAAYLLHAQVENGTQCPLTMTYASVPVLRRHADAFPQLSTDWFPKIVTRDYDRRLLPIAAKTSALIGMGMTEKQGGSDVRANTTTARAMSAATIKSYDSSLRQFMDWCSLNKVSILDVGPRELRAYFDALRADEPLSIGAVGNRFTALSSLFDFMVEQGDTPDNIVPYLRRRYLQIPMRESRKRRFERRPFLSVGQMRRLVRSISDAQERLLVVLAAKTGARVGELVSIDVMDIDWKSQSIRLKPQPKRTHLWVFFDPETERLLRKWLTIRELWTKDYNGPLFLGQNNERLTRGIARKIVMRTTRRIGLYEPGGEPQQKVSPHTFRHFFTTHLHRAGMEREHIKVLRGDSLPDTMDIYVTIDWDELRKEYLRCIPIIAGGPKPHADKRREHVLAATATLCVGRRRTSALWWLFWGDWNVVQPYSRATRVRSMGATSLSSFVCSRMWSRRRRGSMRTVFSSPTSSTSLAPWTSSSPV